MVAQMVQNADPFTMCDQSYLIHYQSTYIYPVSSYLHSDRFRWRSICQIGSKKVVKFSHTEPNM